MALETILLAIGLRDKERANDLAALVTDIAKSTDTTVVLSHVFTEGEYNTATEQLGIELPSEITPNEVARRHETIRTIAEILDREEINHEIRGSVGPHSEEIIRLSTEINADLIVIGGRKRTATGKAIFGSTAQEIMMSSRCPVTFVRET